MHYFHLDGRMHYFLITKIFCLKNFSGRLGFVMLMSFKANQLSNFPKKELRACEFVHDVLSCLSWDDMCMGSFARSVS